MSTSEKMEAFQQRLASGSFEVVSFDVFDTLICRPTRQPDHMYQVIGKAAEGVTGLRAKEFAALRRRAENEQRVLAKAEHEEEVAIADIYQRVCVLSNLDAAAASDLKRVEEEIELAGFSISPLGRELVALAREHSAKIIFLSDTYYTDAFMLKALGSIYSDGDRLITSSANKLTKHSGNLYKALLEGHGARKILHVGDNLVSDVRNALKIGLNVFHVSSGNDLARRSNYHLDESGDDLAFSLAQGALNAKLLAGTGRGIHERLSAIGYNTLGPFWLGFCEFIKQTVQNEEAEEIFFLARDGFIVRKAYETYTGRKGVYLSVSRHTLYLACAHVDFEGTFPLLLQNYSNSTVAEAVSRLLPVGTDLQEIGLPRWALEAMGEKTDSRKMKEALARIIRILTAQIKAFAESQFIRIHEYFDDVGLTKLQKIAIVDIGWHGSMQVLLQRLLLAMKLRIRITGIYAGLYEHAKRPLASDTMTAYLFEYGSNKDAERKVMCGPSLLEVLHSAPHGTTIGYQADPTSGKTGPVYAAADAEEEQYKKFVQHIQKGGIDFLTDYLAVKNRLSESEEITPSLGYASNLLRMIERPSQEEASFLSILGLHPDFGPPGELIRFVEARGNGKRSMWPIGRSMQFRDRLPDWFNEDDYLNSRPDVLAAVQAGDFECGYHHYLQHGHKENART